MTVLRRSQLLGAYNKAQNTLLEESKERQWASKKLREYGKTFKSSERYDIFLSHSYTDARVVQQIRDLLADKGYTVYVDWLEDDHLERGRVSVATAQVIKARMDSCASLIYLTSTSAQKSVWMPWELGYMDAHTGRVAVAPVLEDDENEFKGREYLALYPYLDLTNNSFYIHSSPLSWVGLNKWMKGDNPTVSGAG